MRKAWPQWGLHHAHPKMAPQKAREPEGVAATLRAEAEFRAIRQPLICSISLFCLFCLNLAE